MQVTSVFQSQAEADRLAVQSLLLSDMETPFLRSFFQNQKNLCVLDIGCHSGEKSVARFGDPTVSHVLGLELEPEVARLAEARFGDQRFHFCDCDVEREDFEPWLRGQMQALGIRSFDLINLSFVLLFLCEPETLLKRLLPFLSPEGKILITETDDSTAFLEPDGERLRDFLARLREDPYAGTRSVGKRLPEMLRRCGYRAELLCSALRAEAWETERKKQLIAMFFSYFPEDAALLCAHFPEEERYREWLSWTRTEYPLLLEQILSPASTLSMGMAVYVCSRQKV